MKTDDDCIGSYGEVWMAVQRETGAHRAVKVIERSKLESVIEREQTQQKEDTNEESEEEKEKTTA